MKSFRVEITEVQKCFVDIDADDGLQASDRAIEMYDDGMVTWTDSSITKIEAIPQIPYACQNQHNEQEGQV